jgi:Tfp pilus assembly protein PilE
MKNPLALRRNLDTSRVAAFTLAEIQISMAIVAIVALAIISSHVIGLRLNAVVHAKLKAGDAARYALGLILEDIRTSYDVQVGTGSGASFVPKTNNQARLGSALRIYPSTNLSSFVIYYLDTNDSCLKRFTNSASPVQIVASYVTNTTIFKFENNLGTNLTADQNIFTVGMQLNFRQLIYPAVSSNNIGLSDTYQVSAKITPRTP